MLKLGDKSISKLYLGDKAISKAYLGDKLVFQFGKPTFLDSVVFDGKSYIDTLYKPKSSTSVKIKYKPSYNAVFSCVFGTQDDATTNRMYLVLSSTLYRVQFCSGNLGTFFGISDDRLNSGTNGTFTSKEQETTITIDNYNKQVSIKSEELTNTYDMATYNTGLGYVNCNYSLFLGDRNSSGFPSTNNGFKGEIYGFEIYEKDILVHDFKPCIHPNGTICFYDTISKKYFYNKGTGTFKAGGHFVTSILFDGASYVDTGIAHQTCTIDVDLRFEETGTRQLMGFATSTSQYWGKGANSATIEYFTGTNVLDRTLVTLEYNTDDPTAPTIIKIADGKTSAVSTGTTIAKYTYTIGAVGTNVKSYWCTCEVWGQKTTINGEIIQDLRPYVDKNGVACFKDVVTGNLFYNLGTGSLTYKE